MVTAPSQALEKYPNIDLKVGSVYISRVNEKQKGQIASSQACRRLPTGKKQVCTIENGGLTLPHFSGQSVP